MENVIIVGSGPAAHTAAIYCGRAQLNPILFEGMMAGGIAAGGQLMMSSLLMLPIFLIVDRPWELAMPGLATVGAVVGLAVISTSAAYVIYFHILAVAGATNVLLVTLLVPVSAILLGTVFLGEVLLPGHLLGMAVVGLGLLTIDGRVFRYLQRKPIPAE